MREECFIEVYAHKSERGYDLRYKVVFHSGRLDGMKPNRNEQMTAA
jgi:hypothetical protein